ncbi:hypothetical protein ScPMuIL_009617 [Solemya velum]
MAHLISQYSIFTLLVEILVLALGRSSNGVEVEPMTLSSCVAKVNGSLIDLEILGKTGGFPRFTTVYNKWNYSFNPCLSFSVPQDNPHETAFGDHCFHVAVCKYQENNNKRYYYALGTQDGATFKTSDLKNINSTTNINLDIVFQGILSNRHKESRIHLVCDPTRRNPDEALFRVIEEGTKEGPIAELHHICCCANACSNGTVLPVYSADKLTPNTGSQKLIIIVAVNLVLLLLAGGVGILCHAKRTHLQIYYKLPGIQSQPPIYASASSEQVSDPMLNLPISPSAAAYRDYEPFSKNRGKKRLLLPVLEDCLISSEDIEMGQRLGGGIFGDTHVAEWNDVRVAVKRITISIHENQLNPQNLQQIKDDVTFLSRQRHKNIVMILGLCLEEKHPYVITEYVEGDCMKDFIKHRGPALVWPHRIKMTAEAADGMAFLHSMKPPILHRDLRCSNLFLTENDVVKVADFGLIKLIQPLREMCHEADCCCQGNYSACPQSVRWTAPEVLDNPRAMEVEEVFSTSADVYSFGVVMWELVMCDDPFEDINTEQEVMDVVRQGGRPIFPPDVAVMQQYKDLITQCWNQEVVNRPTFKQVATRLKEFMHPARAFQKLLNNKARLQKGQPCYDSRTKKQVLLQTV